ncbi:unnamed protein product [Symbiodinium sp. CCMP2456]|nr:unnamed protein product [Symbiodinium sp. CCMP2456]
MRRDYLRELTCHRDKQRSISDEAQEVLQDLQEHPVMFFEPLKFVLDDVTKEFIKLVVEERVRFLSRLNSGYVHVSLMCNSGPWDFAFLGDVPFASAAWVREEDLQRQVWVPDPFNARPVALGRLGVAAYRIYLPSSVSLLYFQACALRCAVFINRSLVSQHVGGYSPFWVSLAEFRAHAGSFGFELLVLADSRFTGEAPVHQETYDWLQPGGLLRPVEAHILPQPTQHIAHVSVVPAKDSGTRGNVQVTLKLSEGCGPGMTAKIRFDDHHLLATERKVGKMTQWSEQVPEARLWTPSEPELHVLTLSLFSDGVQVDAVSVRFGLRTVESKEGQIRINGEPVLLLGVNRHENNPFGGIFMTFDALRRDIELLKELGANFVRGSHYSQDQRFLDLCDENGILVWEEAVAWQPSLEDLQDPIFMSQQLRALDETIDASVNHPSVIIWGFLNEGEANVRAAREAYQQLAKFTKLKDPSRLVSWASRHKVRDETLDLADVIAFNDYPGWYDALVPDIPAVWRSYADWVRVHHPGKAVLIAEAGASGLANFLRPANSSGAGLEMWSEDLQAAIVGATIASAVAAGYAGVALWQFADSRVDVALLEEDNQRRQELPVPPILEVGAGSAWVEQVAVGYQITNSPFGHHMALRPRGLNNKGLLSLSRQHRKLAFEVAKEGFRGFCFPIVPGRPLEPSTPTAVVEIESLESLDALQSHAGCSGCMLAAHTWNPADRPPGEPGLRVHGHRLASRAARFVLKAGLLSLAGHSDGRLAAVGGFVTVAGTRDVASSYVAVRQAPTSLWRFEMQDNPNVFLLRVIAGKRCGGVLSLHAGRVPEDLRDANSVYAVVHMDASLATLFKMRMVV